MNIGPCYFLTLKLSVVLCSEETAEKKKEEGERRSLVVLITPFSPTLEIGQIKLKLGNLAGFLLLNPMNGFLGILN